MSDEMIAHVLTDGDCLEEFDRAMERYGVTRSQLCALIGLDPACGEGGEGGRPIPRADLALGRLMVLNRFDHISLLERVRSVTSPFWRGRGWTPPPCPAWPRSLWTSWSPFCPLPSLRTPRWSPPAVYRRSISTV